MELCTIDGLVSHAYINVMIIIDLVLLSFYCCYDTDICVLLNQRYIFYVLMC